jgi:hypothetical protein
MAATRRRWWALVVLLGLLTPVPALAQSYWDGCCGWWRRGPECPPYLYSPCHYWTPEVYKVRACCRPSLLDQFPPGPCAGLPIRFEYTKHRCTTVPPMPTSPYANPAAYYSLTTPAQR